VAVDPGTGRVELLEYLVVEDVGRIVNPLTLHGQAIGGVVQGLGGAFMENLVYDYAVQHITSDLLNYAMPTARTIPTIEMVHLEIPSPLNPLGVKGLGEGSAVGAHAAVANAVADALLPLGVKVDATPLSPGAIGRLLNRDRT